MVLFKQKLVSKSLIKQFVLQIHLYLTKYIIHYSIKKSLIIIDTPIGR